VRRALLCVLASLALGRCSGGSPPASSSSTSPSADAGTSPGTDAGTSPGTDAGTSPGTDAGSPPVVDGGGSTDGGTPGDTDAGTPGGTDGGSPGGTDGGTGATFPASEDPQFVVVRSSAPACSGIGPQGDPGTPTRIARIFPSGYWWCSDGASSDGQGDVAFACQSALPENGWNELYSRDGTVNTQINSWVAARGLADGFITDYVPFGGYKEDLTFAWFDGAWHKAGYSDARDEGRAYAAHAWRPVLLVRRFDRTTQWHDEHGNPLRPPQTWSYVPFLFGVDSLGHALIGQNTPGTADGEIYGMWIDGNDQPVGSPFSWRDPPPANLSYARGEPVIGGGLLFNGRTTLVPSGSGPQPAPQWFATHTEPMRVVNAGHAYAFARTDTSSCSPTVTLFAPDGTECGSISLIGRSSTCPQPAWVGVDGTLIQSIGTNVKDPSSGYMYTIWRWWPAYLR